MNSRLIFENFKVDFDGSKIHHSVGKDRPAGELYFAIHYLVSLSDERLALPEYRKFRGLRCEIQIQTILNHAWAETSHDILYHRANFEGFGTRQFKAIEARLTKIMNQYLLPAGYEFQMVQHDFERLKEGKELFDRNTVQSLQTADNNNDRYEQLKRIKSDLLPFYDDVPAIAPELIRSTVQAIKDARATPLKQIETPMGNFPGHTLDMVVNAGLEIIEDLRYIDIQETFRVLCDLYASATTDEERRRIIQAAERLAHNDLEVWKQAGFTVQKLLQESISALSEADRTAARAVVITVARQILDPEITGTTWNFQTVTFHRGAVRPSEAFGLVRSKVTDLLFRMYDEAKNEQEKREVINTLQEAMRFPGIAQYGDELTTMVLDDTHRIVEFFADRVAQEQFEMLQALEHDYLWLYRRTKDLATAQGDERAAIAEKAKAVLAAIIRFRDRANENEKFVRFKTLVGYESVFPPEWEGDPMDIAGRDTFRAARVAEYVASITNSTADEWYEEIRRCASVRSNDMATFPSFAEFLKQLAARSPDIVFKYLDKEDDVLTGFLPAVLQGLSESNQSAAASKLIEQWTEQGRHLAAIARHLRLTKGASLELIRKVGLKAIDSKDPIAIIEAIAAVVTHKAVDLVDAIVIPGIRYLTATRDTRWVGAIWFMHELDEFLQKLSEEQSVVLLENLTLRPRVSHDDERILRAIAQNHPQAVLTFFKTRLDHEKPADLSERYEAIPYSLQELRKPLARDAAGTVDTIRGWYSTDQALFQYRAGRLLHNIFPGLSPELETKLISVVQEGTEEAIDFVLKVLRAYQGEPFLHGVCKEIVNAVPEDDKRLGEIEIVLESTGVVSGQFGFVEAYQRKKEEVLPWLTDDRPKVRSFAERYRRSLDRVIASEQRRSEADYELRRREWPEDPQ